ncbi:MAG: TraB/GumN family protein [Pseudomonadota bacterium]
MMFVRPRSFPPVFPLRAQGVVRAGLLCGLLVLGMTACGDAPPPDVSEPVDTEVDGAQPADPAVPGAPAIWRVSDEDTTVHLFGTIHILRPETEWKTPAFEQIIETVDAIYFEADVTSLDAQQSMARLVPQLGVYTDGTKLTDVLSDADEKEVKEAADLIGVPMAAMEPMKPWLATVQLSMLALQKQGYDAESGVEVVIGDAAADSDIALRYLETGEQQLRFFADAPIDDQVDFLVASAEQIENDPQLLDRLVAEWAEGDVDAIAEIMANPDIMGSRKIYDTLIVERNLNWTEQITDLMEAEAGAFLIAVGAGHLAGEDSVVEMLRRQGFTVEGP